MSLLWRYTAIIDISVCFCMVRRWDRWARCWSRSHGLKVFQRVRCFSMTFRHVSPALGRSSAELLMSNMMCFFFQFSTIKVVDSRVYHTSWAKIPDLSPRIMTSLQKSGDVRAAVTCQYVLQPHYMSVHVYIMCMHIYIYIHSCT